MAKEQSAAEIAKSFDRQATKAEKLTAEGLRLYRSGKLSQASLDALFHASFLSLHSHFEIFLEDLFYSTMTGASRIAECAPHAVFESREKVQLLFFANVNYVSWMPFDQHAKKISRRAYISGSPFDRLSRQSVESNLLKEFTNIRNAIAHKSKHSLREVEPLIRQMRPGRRNVAEYLQNTSQSTTQFGLYTTGVRAIAAALSAADVAAAKDILTPEDPYRLGETPGPGRYRCVACGHCRNVGSRVEKLKLCSICERRENFKSRQWQRVYG
jgi:hypothetical protein